MNTRRFVASLMLISCASCAPAPTPAPADNDEIKKIAKAKATECQEAFIRGEYEKFVDMTHPKVVEGSGGRKKMIDLLTNEMKGMKAKGIAFKSVKLDDASDPIAAGKELCTSVPFTLEITVPDGRLLTKSALIGISSDNGKNWVFVDASPGREMLKKVFPDLPDKLPIPKKEPPTVIKDE